MKICLRLFARKSGIALLFAGNLAAERADAQVFFHEDFNDLELGQLTNGDGNINGTGLMSPHFEIVSADPSFYYEVRNGEEIQGGRNALKITTAPEPVANSFIRYSFPPIGTDFCLSFLCRVPEKGSGSDTFRIQLMKDDEVGHSFVLRPYDHPDFLLSYGTESGGNFRPSSEGHTFLFIIQYTGNTKRYFVDPNATNLSWLSFSSGGPIQAAEINGIRFSVDSSDLAGPATSLLIDELRLSYTLADSISGIIADPNPPKPSEVEILRGQVVALNELMTQKNAEIESQRLLIETIEAERDSRLTLEEVQDARAGSVVLASDEGGAVKLKFQLEKSADLRVWERMDVAVETEFSLPEGRKFLRFSMSE
ncbi:hypothetical protein N9W62_08615 [Akkermansiaceae bacterium]|nr:hypothetical protein [Akkermansiaceae bacterium]